MAQGVLCEVNSCTHWAEQNKCTAETIFVTSHVKQEVTEAQETDCQTFEKK
ncbi:DUF1540 domain-containing protein [Paenibacillus hunanensis]|uniref:DUF1540 domain-containing protein n=1 Tax=Paenibacillus hunanensis TaxID=539262 RepID=A0ABU1J5I6_9BACL|nr:DUF1540 domain-containing protein [Paenibacillus hunanensis]MCL9659635.1 DUF1540 domain-containing protein [Paenibacillus hunanensis]MDR6246481.1 hypothetical protein [Paenibacillus hunanensis]WPP40672.1 DUF1540 domain-containing protein [Paenibacillus hunanensis]GGJ31680.1 hypothetical protein GCM10008022_45440 [Paenibacillus hunanensis]